MWVGVIHLTAYINMARDRFLQVKYMTAVPDMSTTIKHNAVDGFYYCICNPPELDLAYRSCATKLAKETA